MARRVANVIWFLNSEHILLDESLRLQLLSTLPSNFIGTHEICAVVVVILMTMQLTDMQIAIHSLCDVYPRPLTIWFNLCFVWRTMWQFCWMSEYMVQGMNTIEWNLLITDPCLGNYANWPNVFFICSKLMFKCE